MTGNMTIYFLKLNTLITMESWMKIYDISVDISSIYPISVMFDTISAMTDISHDDAFFNRNWAGARGGRWVGPELLADWGCRLLDRRG